MSCYRVCANIFQAVSEVTSCDDMLKPGVLRISGGVNNFDTPHVYVLVSSGTSMHTRVQ